MFIQDFLRRWDRVEDIINISTRGKRISALERLTLFLAFLGSNHGKRGPFWIVNMIFPLSDSIITYAFIATFSSTISLRLRLVNIREIDSVQHHFSSQLWKNVSSGPLIEKRSCWPDTFHSFFLLKKVVNSWHTARYFWSVKNQLTTLVDDINNHRNILPKSDHFFFFSISVPDT